MFSLLGMSSFDLTNLHFILQPRSNMPSVKSLLSQPATIYILELTTLDLYAHLFSLGQRVLKSKIYV